MANPLANLSARDRKILLWSVPIVALLLVALLAKSLLGERQQATADLDLVLEDLAWLQTQKDSMAQLNQGCAKSPWNDGTINRLAAKHGVTLSTQAEDSGAVRMVIEAGHGNRVIAFLNDLECQGARVEELTLETLDQQGAVKGSAVVQSPVT